VTSWEQFMHVTENLHDRHIHDRLQTDLIDHIWTFAGNQQDSPLINFMYMNYISIFLSNYVIVNYLYWWTTFYFLYSSSILVFKWPHVQTGQRWPVCWNRSKQPARTGCIAPLRAQARWAGPRPILYLSANANGPGRTLWVAGLRRPVGDALRSCSHPC
jgi:hypothetical protein